MPRVLVVEDDEPIAEPLVRALRRDGHDAQWARTGAEALEAAQAGPFDLVLLDLGLPDIDGIDVCQRLRQGDRDVAILMLTARSEELDAIVGLDAGADDYVTKPFRVGELLARVRAQLRRRGEAAVAAQDVRVDPGARRAWLADGELELTAKEFDLLALLVQEAGTVVPRERIMERVWDEHWFGSTKTLDVHVSALRRKLSDDPASPRYISTVRSVGFRFELE
ncbi:MAG TPA: response regulator transcription factor [Acidimicrobiales bacterium]|nr:response regulator transcription factor [Acidimicrobiales bacterium]